MKPPAQRQKNANAILSVKNVWERSGLMNVAQSSSEITRQNNKIAEGENGTILMEPAKEVSLIKHDQVQKNYQRIKLQLFPIDDTTCKGLQKDGHNPYLELILGARKKISSVIKHIHAKWGNSLMANGELMLFPYETQLENLPRSQRWTRKDVDISSIDVYVAVGSPSIFRLRYCWLPWPMIGDHKSKLFVQPNQEREIIPTDNSSKLCIAKPEPFQVDTSSQRLADLNRVNNTTILLDEGFTNISFGDLLNKVPPTTSDISQCVHSPLESARASQIPFICDSFDAAIASHIARHQALSIWDAEETRHGFPLSKAASSRKQGTELSVNADAIVSCNQHSCSQKMRSVTEVGNEALHAESRVSKELSTDQKPHKVEEETVNVIQPLALVQNCYETSLGFSGIHWDSLGPLDSVMASKPIVSGDSIGFSNLLASSRNAL